MRIDTLQGKFNTLLSSINSIAITIGQTLAPSLGALADAITPVIQQFESFIAAHPDITAGVILAAGGFLTLSFALTGVRLAIAGINLATLTGLSALATTAPAAGGWLKLAFGLGAVAAALSAIDQNKDAIKNFFESMRVSGGDPLTDTKGGPFEITDNVAGYLKQLMFEKLGADKDASLISILKDYFKQRQIEDLPQIPAKGDLPPGVSLPRAQPRLIFGPSGADGGGEAKPKISLAGAGQAKSDAKEVADSLASLNRLTVVPTIGQASINDTIRKVRQLKGELESLNSLNSSISTTRGVHADTGPAGGSGW